MTIMSPWRQFGLAAALCCGLATAAAAQDPPKSAETAAKDCVSQDGDFRMHGKSPAYVVTLTNSCERRQRCRVNLYVTTAFGPAQGQATLILAPRAAGAAAKKTYALRVKALGGMAQGSRQCDPI